MRENTEGGQHKHSQVLLTRYVLCEGRGTGGVLEHSGRVVGVSEGRRVRIQATHTHTLTCAAWSACVWGAVHGAREGR